VIQQIAERTQGAWKPSPGSVYPTLQQLEDEGLIRSTEAEGRKAFELTDAGHTYVAEHADDISATWQAFDETTAGDETFDLKRTISQLAPAVWQVAMAGTPQQQEAARGILSEARRKLYALLADGDDEP
ncbi:MAG: PadR family transcriptional regulator, partial [Nocardioidaceae bacterium]